MANQLTGKQTMSPLTLEIKHTFKIAREQEEKKKAMPFVTELCNRGRLQKAHPSLRVVPSIHCLSL